MMPSLKGRRVRVCLVLLMCLLPFACAKKEEQLLAVIDAHNGVLVNGIAPRNNETLHSGSTIVTEKSAYCLVARTGSLLVIYANSTIVFEQLPYSRKEQLVLTVQKGIVDMFFSSPESVIVKGNNFIYEGDVAAMRCIHDGDATDIWFMKADGSVRLFTSSGEISRAVDDKTKVAMYQGRASYYALRYDDVSQLQKLMNVKGDAKKIDERHLSFIRSELIHLGNINISEMIQYSLFKYQRGSLQMVVTKNGAVHKGFVSARGTFISVETPDSVKTIPQSNVKHVLHYNPNVPIEGQAIKYMR